MILQTKIIWLDDIFTFQTPWWNGGILKNISNRKIENRKISHHYLSLGVFKKEISWHFCQPHKNNWSGISFVKIKYPSLVFVFIRPTMKPNHPTWCISMQKCFFSPFFLDYHSLFCHSQKKHFISCGLDEIMFLKGHFKHWVGRLNLSVGL